MLVVVGGHSRHIGKTSVAAGLIRALRDRQWTAVKITQHEHGMGSQGQPYALSEELRPNHTDSGRFLAAGARRSFWLRAAAGEWAAAADVLQRMLKENGNVIVESNSILQWVQPDVFLMLLDHSCADFKPSSLRFMDRADALVVIDRESHEPLRAEVVAAWNGKPRFTVKPPDYGTQALTRFVKSRGVAGAANGKTSTRLRP